MRSQVSRLRFLLRDTFPSFDSGTCPFVRFTVTGVVRNSHPCSLGGRAAGAFTQIRTLFICG